MKMIHKTTIGKILSVRQEKQFFINSILIKRNT